MSMAITKESYKDLKEYWDYQRKVQYNKEVVHNMADTFEGRVYNEYGTVDLKEMKDLLWTRVKPNDYEEPRKGWVPEEPSLRFEDEGPAHMPQYGYEKPKKGKPVVLKAKGDWAKAFDDDNNI
jgi:hypothetical protein